MRFRGPAGPVLSLLLLLGCTVETGNQAENAGAGGSSQTAPAPQQQPDNSDQAPQPSSEVTLAAAPESATGGATMTLTLSNGSKGQIGYNLCTSELETSAGRPVPTSRVCTMELRTLEPGATADYRYRLPINMVDGRYRFSTKVQWMESERQGTVQSNGFEVR